MLIENTQKKPLSIEKVWKHIFINENLTPTNNKIAFHCRELKRNGRIDKINSRDGIVQIFSKDIENGNKIKIVHMKRYMISFQISISEKMHEKIITIHCNQATKFV